MRWCHAGPAGRLRGRGRAWEVGNPARAHHRLFDQLAGRPVPRRPGRLEPPACGAVAAVAVRCAATPIVLLPRRDLAVWTAMSIASNRGRKRRSSSRAQAVADALRDARRLFFDELLDAPGCCAPSWRMRWANWWPPDGSAPTALPACVPCCCRRPSATPGAIGRLRRHQLSGIEDAGRWSLARARLPAADTAAAHGSRDGGARRPRAAAALRRGVLEAAGARGAVAAAVARAAARLPPAGGAWRNPRRALRRGSGRRAVRPARGDRAACAPCARAPTTANWSASAAAIR